MEERLLARLRVKGPRRVVAVVVVTLLAGALLYIAVAPDVSWAGRLCLFVISGVMLWGAWAIQKATEHDLLLTPQGIADESGRVIAEMDNVASVEKGIFAVKPTSGFTIRLKAPMKAAWAPGVWWRFGRNIGVGGAVSGFEAKAMAEILDLALADRAGTLKRD